MNKFIALCVVIFGVANIYAFDGVVGETLKGVGYVLFGDGVYDHCHNGHTTVVVGNSPYVTQLYRSGYNNYRCKPQLVVQVPTQQPVQVVEQYPVTTPVYSTPVTTIVEQPTQPVSVTQVARPTRVWVPTRYEQRTTAEGLLIKVKIPGHYIMTY